MTGAVLNYEKIAIIQLARFGDLVQTSALLQNLKKEKGKLLHISLFVDERTSDIAEMLENVDDVIPIPLKKLPSNLSDSIYTTYAKFKSWVSAWYDGQKYDKLILLNQGTLPSAIGYLIKAVDKDGPFDFKPLPRPHRFLNTIISDRSANPVNLYEVWAAYGPGIFPLPHPSLNKSILGIPFASTSVEAKIRSCKNNNIALNLGAGAAGRTPSKEKLAVLMDLILKKTGYNLLLLGTDDETGIAAELLLHVASEEKQRVFDFTGKTNIPQLASLLNNVEVLVSADTGTIHLAAAVGIKILGLYYAGANPCETGPFSEKSMVLVHKNTLDQNEENIRSHPMEELDMNKVFAVLKKQVNNKFDIKEIHDEFDPFVLYMARPSSMGIDYRYVGTKEHFPLGKAGRWLPEIRRKLWGEKYPEKTPHKGKSAGSFIKNSLNKADQNIGLLNGNM